MYFARDNFIVIQGFAIKDLNLSGNELICYSIIYGFTQDGESKFSGGLSYIAEALNISKNSAKSVLERLISKGLIVKIDRVINRIKFCDYVAVVPDTKNLYPVQETCTPRTRNLYTPPVQETCTNNNIIKEEYNIIHNIAEQKDLFGNTQEKKETKTLFRNSEIYKLANIEDNDYSRFEQLFDGAEFEQIDLIYYFHSVADWSDSSNKKRTKRGWIATIRNFIRGDIEKGKLHTKTKQLQQNNGFDFDGAAEYLNM